MKNYVYNKKRDTAKWIITFTLILTLLAGLIGIWAYTLRSDHAKNEPSVEDQGGAIIGESVGNGVSLTSARLKKEDYADYGVSPLAETAYTLTAVVSPDNASDKTVSWSIAWENEDSSWANGKTVTDYVTLDSRSGSSATVECLQAFGAQIKVTATSNDNANVSASVTVDYAQRLYDTRVAFELGANIMEEDVIIALGYDLAPEHDKYNKLKIFEYADDADTKFAITDYETSEIYTVTDSYETHIYLKFSPEFFEYLLTNVDDFINIGFECDLGILEEAFMDITEGIVPNYDIFTSLFGAENLPEVIYEMFANYEQELPAFTVYIQSIGKYSEAVTEYPLFLDYESLSIPVSNVNINGGNIIF